MKNTILDPAMLTLSYAELCDEDLRAEFLAHLERNLELIYKYAFTKIYWGEAFESLLSQLFFLIEKKHEYWYNQMIPKLYVIYGKYFSPQSKLLIPHNCDSVCCEVSPKISHEYEQNAYNAFLKLLHTLVQQEESIFLCLGIVNRSREGYRFYCGCHQCSIQPEVVNYTEEWYYKKEVIEVSCKENLKKGINPYFPNIEISKEIVADTADGNDLKRRIEQNSSAKASILIEVGTKVATINGYSYNAPLSSFNQKLKDRLRHVFESDFGSENLYLSIDFENSKGAFEVCDSAGTHLGEFGFNGKRSKKADSSGKHNLILL